MIGVFFVLTHAVVFAVAAATFYAAGRRAMLSVSFANFAEELGFSIALGMGISGTALFFLALAGLFTRAAVISLLILIQLLGIPVWADLARRLRKRRRRMPPWLLVLVVFGIPEFWLGLYPPHAFDETMYHLPFAKALALGHSVEFLSSLKNPVYPQLAESIFGAFLVCADDISCHFVALLAVSAVAAALFGIAVRFGSRTAGILAACVWLGTPLVVSLASIALVDLELALFASLCVLAWEIHHASGDRRFLLLAGVLAGFAAGTKYLGIPLFLCIPFLIAVSGARGRKRVDILVFLAAGITAAFPFYLWIFASTGNPIFPFLPAIFGQSEWAKHAYLDTIRGVSAAGIGLFTRSGATKEALLSAVLLLSLPFAAMAAFKWPRHRRGAGLAILWSISAGAVNVRFLLPTLPLFFLAAADGLWLATVSPRAAVLPVKKSVLAASVAAILAIPGIVYAGRRIQKQWPLCVGPPDRNTYLRSQLPAYGAVLWLNTNAGRRDGVYGLYTENMVYFADGRIFGDTRGPARFDDILPAASNPRRLAMILRAWGANFLLYDRSRGFREEFRDAISFRAYFEPVYQNGDIILWRILNPRRAPEKM